MALTKHKIGEFIELLDERNTDLKFCANDVRGVNNLKQLMPTKSDLTRRDLTKFQIVRPGSFVFNHRTSRNGSKFSIAYNDSELPVICTEDYVVFRVKSECTQQIMDRWLYLYFNRPEFDRYAITNSWGSSTEFFNLADICDIDIDLPPLEIQRRYVAIYEAMRANQQTYEHGLENLKLTYEAIINEYKHKSPIMCMGDILQEIDHRNVDGKITNVQGINIYKQFMPSVANTNGVNLSKYKLVEKGQFAFSGMQTGRDKCIRIALYGRDEQIIISPAYSVLELYTDKVLAEYVMMWFSREEVDRLGWFMSDASIRTNLDMESFFEIAIPVPPLDIQASIVKIYDVYNARREIGEQLKTQLRDICPILIKGAIDEARREAGHGKAKEV